MKTTLSEREGNTVKLAVEVSSEELQEAFDARLKQVGKEVRIPGFRQGKVPLAMVRQRLGDEAILIDAVENAMGGWFAAAALELGIDPVDRPQIELADEETPPELGKPLGFSASVTVMPEVELGQYKGVEASKDPVEVTTEEVDAQMDRSTQRVRRTASSRGPAGRRRAISSRRTSGRTSAAIPWRPSRRPTSCSKWERVASSPRWKRRRWV